MSAKLGTIKIDKKDMYNWMKILNKAKSRIKKGLEKKFNVGKSDSTLTEMYKYTEDSGFKGIYQTWRVLYKDHGFDDIKVAMEREEVGEDFIKYKITAEKMEK